MQVDSSGHGSQSKELVLEDKDGYAKPVSESALVALFRNLKDNIRLVLLNACHSESQAKAISSEIDCTIGMSRGIGDDAAITFSSWFYGALGFGRSVGEAYEQGRTALMLNGIPEESTPKLLARPGVDSLRISFVGRTPKAPILPPLALEILQSAIDSNSPVNFIRHDGGVAVLAGAKQFECGFNMERAAQLEEAVAELVRRGLLRRQDEELHYVTSAGFETIRSQEGQPKPQFAQVKDQMPDLIAEMKADLMTEDGKFIREFFVMSRKHTLGGSSKPRFTYYHEEHDNLHGKLDVLENLGYVSNIRPGNVPIYRMTAEFVNLVLEVDEPK